MGRIDWPAVYRGSRDVAVTVTALVLLIIEVLHEARTEVLLLIASMLGVPTYLRSSAAVKNAANGVAEAAKNGVKQK